MKKDDDYDDVDGDVMSETRAITLHLDDEVPFLLDTIRS